jgi:circadian clock protein KaiC
MSETPKVHIQKLSTGVPGLDQALGGGLPEYSFNLIAGAPGTGKTTLAHQIMFANAADGRPALYFTVLGEPALKMLCYQQQMSFFAPARVDRVIHFVNLSQEVLEKSLGKVLETIEREVREIDPAIVVVDSFRTVVRTTAGAAGGEMELQDFVQRLALRLSGWQATTFLVGEYLESEARDNPVFTVADGILWLYQSVERNSSVRKLQVVKMRGQAPMPGLHTFRITGDGIQVFPRMFRREERPRTPAPRRQISTGVLGLDEMLGGGILVGDAALVAGPSGSGKSVLATQFIADGARRGEHGIMAVFEEHPQEYMERARGLGFDLEEMARQGQLKVIYLRPLDLSVDETFQEIRDAVGELGATRVVIDSLSGFEVALAPTFREDFRESLYRLVGSLTGTGVTVLMTVEVVQSFSELNFTPHAISFLTDDIILQRYVEMDGELRKLMTVVKMRGSQHSKEMRAYEVTSEGLVVGASLREYRGLITGVPELKEFARRLVYPGLTDQETAVLHALAEIREATIGEMAQRTGLEQSALGQALDRLVALRYVLGPAKEGKTLYRPAARPPES